jgi:dihydroorotate dehydrogenase
VAAGPLLNGRWIRYYAALGFDVLTYKTVRSRAWPCHAMPNLQPVALDTAQRLVAREALVDAEQAMTGSWAVSFGMPSQAPDVWRRDIAETREVLPTQQILSVSVVATPAPDWSIDEVADDYARCARWAAESGADTVELNFSCPNVATCDGQLYQNPAQARHVAACVRAAVRDKPLLVKLGHVAEERQARELVTALASHVDALVMVNCVAARVRSEHELMFAGQRRGIAGAAIRAAALEQVRMFKRVAGQVGPGMKIVGCGGISRAADVISHLEAGACGVQVATAAIVDPAVAIQIRREWHGVSNQRGASEVKSAK